MARDFFRTIVCQKAKGELGSPDSFLVQLSVSHMDSIETKVIPLSGEDGFFQVS